MIYTLTGWEKLTAQSSWLFANGNTVVSQRPKFATSKESLILAALTVILPGIFLILPILPLLIGGSPRAALSSLSPENIIQTVFILFGVIIAIKSKDGIRIRKEQGGIHPEDTLYVLDASRKIFSKQKGTTEETVAPFQDLTLEVRIEHGNKTTNYRIYAIYPQGKTPLANMKSKKAADELLTTIKSRLQIT